MKFLVLLLLPLTAFSQTKIGWTQVHMEGTQDYYVEYCDELNCYAEFGFESPFFKNTEQFYFFKKDSKDNAKLFFIADTIDYMESFDNWHVYFMKGVSLTHIADTAKEVGYSLMLQTYTLEQWKNDTIPTLIQVYPVTAQSIYPVYTFEPTCRIDTTYTSYQTSHQRAIQLHTKQEIEKAQFFELDDSTKFEMIFYHGMLSLQYHDEVEHWILDENLKVFQDGHWKYTFKSVDLNGAASLVLIFPKNTNWQHAIAGELGSVKIWTSILPDIVSEVKITID